MDAPLESQPRSRKTKAIAIITGIIALLVVCAWFVYEYADVIWSDQAYKTAWYLGSDPALYEFKDGTLTKASGIEEGVLDAARAGTSYALIASEGMGAYVSLNGERVGSGVHLRDIALSPDGTQVVFARSTTGDTMPSAWEVVRVVGGKETVIASGFSPYFLDETHVAYFNEKGVWLYSENQGITQLSGIPFSDVEKTMTAQSPDRTGLVWISDIDAIAFIFEIPSIEPLEFIQVASLQTIPAMPIGALALSNDAAYALHAGGPTALWIHTTKHPAGRRLETLTGVDEVTDIIFAP